MDKRDNYYSFEDNMHMNLNMEMNPYMGVHMQPMMQMGYPMMANNIMANMAMHQFMNMHPMNIPMIGMQPMMPTNPMMMRMNIEPPISEDSIDDEDYMNYMINMNKYMAYIYEAEAYRLQAMEYINKMEK